MIRALTFVLIAIAGMAQATPERITTSDDRIVGATQTHLYVVRTITDNLGSYYSALIDQHLIEISLETGESTKFWPIRSIAVSNLETDDFLSPGQVTERAGETHDLIRILQSKGAVPMAPEARPVADLSMIEGALMRGDAQLLTPFGIRAAGRAQLGILREAYPEIETEEEYRKGERIDFYNLYAEGPWVCSIQSEGQTLSLAQGRAVVAKLACEDDYFSGAWSFHVIISENNGN